MADFAPTKSQSDAINTHGRAVLVSAAAGSGKTRVLTERLLAAIENGADIDSFLIITFTKAAAAELRSRILDEISKRLAAEPDNKRLRRQSALCAKAQIGTIDSFCQTFLRENCHAAQLAPEFKVIEEDRAEAIKARCIERVLDECYESPDEDFCLLADTIGAGRDDSRLATAVLDIHRKTQSHARPDKWLREQLDLAEREWDDAGKTPWGKEILTGVRLSAEYWAERMDEMCHKAAEYEIIEQKYGESLAETALSLRDLARACGEGWDKAREMLPVSFPKFKMLKNSPNEELSEHIREVRKLCKASTDKYLKILSDSSDKLLSDMKACAPALRALIELTLKFDKAYSDAKRRRAEVDFADLEHLTAQLLTNEDGSPTPLARETAQRYREIMVDEYQDVNRVQDDIFTALSDNGNNLFMVGDVKQSIYRFRLADPLIFTGKYNRFAELCEAEGNEPVKIMLRENFRSRREVIDAVNCVFDLCMSERLGEIAYDDNARLKCGAQYDGSVAVPELVLINVKGNEDDLRDTAEKEASVVADRIEKLLASGMTVGSREIRYGDIAILMRSANSVGEIYRRELLLRGIPVASGQSGSFFQDSEVSDLMSLLAVIDNPHKDVPLIAVLRSPAFGFDADELTEIRLADRKSDFFTALQKAAEKNEKCAGFLNTLARLRELAPDTEVSRLVQRIYDELDIEALCAAMQDPQRRLTNLQTLITLAKRFESGGMRGLHRFNRWLARLAERGGDIGAPAGGDAVQIMTIHKSKGLEFPVVFLCDTSRKFNNNDLSRTVLVHPRLGLGAKVYDVERSIEYPGLQRNAIKQVLRREQLSEEMRLLYVALTRARERLIITAAVKDPEGTLKKMMLRCTVPPSPEVLLTSLSMADWLMYAELCDGNNRLKLGTVAPSQEPEEHIAAEPVLQGADMEIVEHIAANVAFRYPHEDASRLPSKITATELKRLGEPDPEAQELIPQVHYNFRRPELGAEQKLSPTQRGTATHMLLQFMDYARTGSPEEIRRELERLTAAGFLSRVQADAVDVDCVYRLFSSELGKRILAADSLRREFRFSLLCPVEKFFGAGEGEQVLLQGVMDCVIEENGELTIIDYKTDRVRADALHERAKGYEKQLAAYAYAAHRMTGKPVRECVLYFLYAGETVILRNK